MKTKVIVPILSVLFPLGVNATPLDIPEESLSYASSWRKVVLNFQEEIEKNEFKEFFISDVVLHPGDRGTGVMELREALTGHGFESRGNSDPEFYDLKLRDQVKLFQRKFGLISDGVVGEATRYALMNLKDHLLSRISQGLGQPEYSDQRSIVVNVPAQMVRVFENGNISVEKPVIVGRLSRRTPDIETVISGITFNPPWYVPPGIERVDILPSMEKDPSFARRKNLTIYDVEDNWRRVEPEDVDWASRPEKYTFVQKPSSETALGEVKFNMWNDRYIYLHDTPDRSHFEWQNRMLSSGCVRVADIQEVAKLLVGNERWDERGIDEILSGDETYTLEFEKEIPVRIEYRLVDVVDGDVVFYPDIYHRMRRPDIPLHKPSERLGAAPGTEIHKSPPELEKRLRNDSRWGLDAVSKEEWSNYRSRMQHSIPSGY